MDLGLTCLSELIPPLVQPSHFEEWLRIKTGVAFTIMQYILADLDAINLEKWVLPQASST